MNALDPNLLAGVVVSELIKALAKGAAARSVQLLDEIRKRFDKDERAKRSLKNFEADPMDADYVDYFSKHLQRILEVDSEFRAKISAMVPTPSKQTMTATGPSSTIKHSTQSTDAKGSDQSMNASGGGKIIDSKQEIKSRKS